RAVEVTRSRILRLVWSSGGVVGDGAEESEVGRGTGSSASLGPRSVLSLGEPRLAMARELMVVLGRSRLALVESERSRSRNRRSFARATAPWRTWRAEEGSRQRKLFLGALGVLGGRISRQGADVISDSSSLAVSNAPS